jgi:5'-nucleotidase
MSGPPPRGNGGALKAPARHPIPQGRHRMDYQADILISNDDGIHAPGLAALKDALAPLGSVLVVAPDVEKSAFGHGITMMTPLRAAEVHRGGKFFGLSVTGTPADCVKLALQTLMPRLPKLVVSGINLGPNTGTNVLYSGTVAAAREGTIFNVPSIAASLRSFQKDADFSLAAAFARRLAEWLLAHPLPSGVLLNLNVPAEPREKIQGVKATRLARYRYRDRYEVRKDPRGRTYYWLAGEDAEVLEAAPDLDAVALEAGFVSVTPLGYALTSDESLSVLTSLPGLK